MLLPGDDDLLVTEVPLPSLNEFEVQIFATPEMQAFLDSAIDHWDDLDMLVDACLPG